ncbi:hypothetical protein WMY93_020883 [Mugilogobius chulae]|uniref:Uncharacterized protein n=1 Tax=Mugilogobius chulae TaxID=88201 RepID=A0AAW0NG78_9GOBI
MGLRMRLSGACLLLWALSYLPPRAHSHPQPCQVLKRIGHTVRLGALHVQPRLVVPSAASEPWSYAQVRTGAPAPANLRTKGTNKNKSQARQREDGSPRENRVFSPRDSVLLAVEAVNRAGILPYNLTMELVLAVGSGLGELPAFSFASSDSSSAPDTEEDPLSFVESVCHTVVVQGDEFVKLEFVSSALHVPVVSVVPREFTRFSQVKLHQELCLELLHAHARTQQQ